MRRPLAISTATGRGRIPLIVVLGFIAGLGAWWYFAPRSMPDWLARSMPASPSLGPPFYIWCDDQGRLQVTDQPPADRPYETVRYDPKTNVVPDGKSP